MILFVCRNYNYYGTQNADVLSHCDYIIMENSIELSNIAQKSRLPRLKCVMNYNKCMNLNYNVLYL